jgi:hypothetical protein
MRRTTIAAFVALLVGLVFTSSAGAFSLKDLDVSFTNADGTPATQAGSHPFAMTIGLGVETFTTAEGEVPGGEIEDLTVTQMPGFAGNPTAVPTCSAEDFSTREEGRPNCPDATALGYVGTEIEFTVISPAEAGKFFHVPVYNLTPPPGVPARLGFVVLNVPITLDVTLSEEQPYNLVAKLRNLPQAVLFYRSTLTLWGNPADPAHDSLRGDCVGEVGLVTPGPVSLGKCPVGIEEKPFLTLPRSCNGPLATVFAATSWLGESFEGSALTHDDAIPSNPRGMTGCGTLGFAPHISSVPSTSQAETGSGLDFSLDIHDEGLTNPEGTANSDIKKAEVTFPEGVTINPSVGEGLGVCTPADLKRETADSPPGEGCPNASKLGTVRVQTPLLSEEIGGSIFLAQQDDPQTSAPGAENPFDTLIALYFVLKDPNAGVSVKLPVKVEPDPSTGRLIATLDDNPQVPFNRFEAHLRTGTRAALITPPACGTYETEAKFTPWANPSKPLTTTSSFQIGSGVGGGPCPAGGVPPFHPHFEAGALNNNAGAFSPFNMRLIRSDGEQDMTKFSSVLPPGELGSLAGVGKCPDSAIAVAKSKTGRQEQASPSCPANSLIGHTLAGAGVGGALTYVGGQIYLGGPYHGDPLSVISVTPAIAGPFDAGTVVVQLALTLNPKTAEVEVDGANSDPIPHILKGIVLKVRDLRVYVDRPNFTLNPTSCDESSAKATLFGSYLDVFSPSDDRPADLSTRYQAANCLNLGFKPSLSLSLKGGTKRGGHPGLIANYTPRKGDANVKGLVVRLPRSAFLDQGHIRTICTRVQFAAKACPPAAQYGSIRAWTPLLDTPLEGPVWLRSSSHKLPDLVFDLHGLVDIEVATRIDSAKGGIRASLENLPDAPLSKVELRMQGGKKGLIINSRNLCGAVSKANVEYSGQNGKEAKANPVMRADCGGKRKHKRASH